MPVTLCAVLLHPGSLAGQAPATLLRRVDAYVAPLVRMRDFAGTVLVAQHGRILLTRQYGIPAAASPARTDSTARYQIGSVSKTMTAAAIELLVEEGKLAFSDPVTTFLPGFVHGDSITVEMLLGHTSGLMDYYVWPEYAAGWNRPLTDSAFQAIIESKPLDFAPGTRSNYSNTGYRVLGAIVERVSGLSLAQFLATRVFGPTGMTRAGVLGDGGSGHLLPGRDPGFPPAWLQPPLAVGPGWLKGNGSVYASAADLFRWAEAVRSDRLVNGSRLKYPFGWGKRTRAGHPTIEDTGRVPTGYATYLGIVPDAELVVVVLSNIQAAVVEQMGIDLVSLTLDQPYQVSALRAGQKAPVHLPRTTLEALAGRYQIAPGFVLSVRAVKQGLELAGPDGLFLPLDTQSASSFFFRPLYVSVRFDRDSLSRPTALDWNGQFKAQRLP